MPMPRRVARFNRMFLNPVVKRFGRHIPPFLIVEHVGRRSGRAYETPVWAFRTADGFVICLTYGLDTEWVKNLRAAGESRAVYRGQVYALTDARIEHGDPRAQPIPSVIGRALALTDVHDFLHVRAVPSS